MRKTTPAGRGPLRPMRLRSGPPPSITVRAAPGNPSRGLVQMGPLTVRAALGRSGRTAFKREGDGATPIATMRLLYGYARGERVRGLQTALPIIRTGSGMLWCDASGHPAYNQPVQAPFQASHEEMMRPDCLYDVCLVLDWNITARRRHRGSAIFFHLIHPGYTPTAGCIAVSLADMKRLIRFMRCGTTVRVL